MDISKIVSNQKSFFNTNTTKSVAFRIATLQKLKQVLKDNEQVLYTAIYSDFKKSEFETYLTELALIYNELNEAIRKVKQWSAHKSVRTNWANFPAKSYIIPEPLGTVLVVSAWNYPYQLALIPTISAIAAGNTVVIKPSEIPSHTSAVLAQLINANFNAKHLVVVEGGVAVSTTLLQQKWNHIFFTGSTSVGKIVYKAAAEQLTPVTLELGGKSPAFVCKDCNIKLTAKRLVWAKFLNAGQTCIAPDYILVDEAIKTKLLMAIKAELNNKYVVDGTVQDNYVQIINNDHFKRLTTVIPTDKIYIGGEYNAKNRLISPTVLENISFDDAIMQSEIFGPILPVISFSNIDNVIKEVKNRDKPLALYVYSKNKKILKKILTEISFGGGAINESLTHISNPNLPFGGVGASGIGACHSKAGFETFTHYKSILQKSFLLEPSVKYKPFTSFKRRLLAFLLE